MAFTVATGFHLYRFFRRYNLRFLIKACDSSYLVRSNYKYHSAPIVDTFIHVMCNMHKYLLWDSTSAFELSNSSKPFFKAVFANDLNLLKNYFAQNYFTLRKFQKHFKRVNQKEYKK